MVDIYNSEYLLKEYISEIKVNGNKYRKKYRVEFSHHIYNDTLYRIGSEFSLSELKYSMTQLYAKIDKCTNIEKPCVKFFKLDNNRKIRFVFVYKKDSNVVRFISISLAVKNRGFEVILDILKEQKDIKSKIASIVAHVQSNIDEIEDYKSYLVLLANISLVMRQKNLHKEDKNFFKNMKQKISMLCEQIILQHLSNNQSITNILKELE
ncbi:MAG TPA: hypothetical protein EYO61_06710 [Campylobacterales bacterium]|nr:hypothetical protein [Campylobacterales bacterium]HIO71167.1 hypothetical protein [Campylobacterales bacterium]